MAAGQILAGTRRYPRLSTRAARQDEQLRFDAIAMATSSADARKRRAGRLVPRPPSPSAERGLDVRGHGPPGQRGQSASLQPARCAASATLSNADRLR